MNLNSKKTSFLILGITAIIFSRIPFAFFNDPEGPNLLVVGVAAAILYFLSLTVYEFASSVPGHRKFWLAFFIQIVLAVAFYFFGK